MSNAKYIQEGYTAITPYLYAKARSDRFSEERVRRRGHTYSDFRRLLSEKRLLDTLYRERNRFAHSAS
jgi:hypothetical protein